MPVNIHGKEYYTVTERLMQLHGDYKQDHPIKITTKLFKFELTRDDKGNKIGSVLIRAKITVPVNATKTKPASERVFTGHAFEDFNSNYINETSAVENCETSAIGRALAAAGYIGKEYCSAEELMNAKLNQKPREASEKQKKFLMDLINKMDKQSGEEMINKAKEAKTFYEFSVLIEEAKQMTGS
jgi:hypothetical protein